MNRPLVAAITLADVYLGRCTPTQDTQLRARAVVAMRRGMFHRPVLEAHFMTREQLLLARVVARVMRAAGVIVLALWLLACGAMALFSTCALLGVPTNVRYSGTPAVWVGQLVGSAVAALLGSFFIRFWRSLVDRTLAQVPGINEKDSETYDVTAKSTVGRLPISTTLHITLQFVLPVVASIVALGLCAGYLWKADSPFKSGVIFVCVMGIATVVPRLAMLLVPARCPQCHGKAYCRGSKPIIFVCRLCSGKHNTRISFEAASEDT
jgi:hypothetical protein